MGKLSDLFTRIKARPGHGTRAVPPVPPTPPPAPALPAVAAPGPPAALPGPLIGVGPQDIPVGGLGAGLLALYLLALTGVSIYRLHSWWPYLAVGCSQTEAVSVTEENESPGAVSFAPDEALPELNTIFPQSGPVSGGNPVILRGRGFTRVVSVRFGDKPPQQVESESSTGIRVTAPPHPAGPALIEVSNNGGKVSIQKIPYRYREVRPVKLSSVSPNSGPITGGSRVRIQGSGFLQQPEVKFDGVPATKVQGDDSLLVVTTPSHSIGPVNVDVRNSDGQSATLHAAYVFTCPDAYDAKLFLATLLAGFLGAILHALRSLFWYVGYKTLVRSWVLMYILLPFTGALMAAAFYLIIRAGLFSQDRPSNSLLVLGIGILVGLFSDQAAEKLKKITEGLLTAAPQGVNQAPAAPGAITQIQTLAPPMLVSVDPGIGSEQGNDPVILTGTGFSAGDKVFFEKLPAVSRVLSSTSISVLTPPHPTGWVNVMITNAGQQSHTLPKAFFYTSVWPSFGSKSGGTKVIIKGVGFMGAATVTFGGTAANNVQVVDPNTLTADTPPSAREGIVDVKVTVAGNVVLDLPQGFRYTG